MEGMRLDAAAELVEYIREYCFVQNREGSKWLT
jgi:hypothetical protein